MYEMSLLTTARMKKYWKGIEELIEADAQQSDQELSHEFPVNLIKMQITVTEETF